MGGSEDVELAPLADFSVSGSPATAASVAPGPAVVASATASRRSAWEGWSTVVMLRKLSFQVVNMRGASGDGTGMSRKSYGVWLPARQTHMQNLNA